MKTNQSASNTNEVILIHFGFMNKLSLPALVKGPLSNYHIIYNGPYLFLLNTGVNGCTRELY